MSVCMGSWMKKTRAKRLQSWYSEASDRTAMDAGLVLES